MVPRVHGHRALGPLAGPLGPPQAAVTLPLRWQRRTEALMSQLKRASVFTRKVSAFLFPVLYSCTSCRVSRAGCVLGWMTAFQGQGEPSCPRRGGAQGRGQPGGVRAQCPWFTRIRNLEHETSREPPMSWAFVPRAQQGRAGGARVAWPTVLWPQSRLCPLSSQRATGWRLTPRMLCTPT